MKVILAPRPQEYVLITVPSRQTMKALTSGGFGRLPGDAVTDDLGEDETMRIEASASMPRSRAIDNMVRCGHDPDFAAHYCDAIVAGGETDTTALDMIRKHRHPEGGDQYAVDHGEVPSDRRLRNAWVNRGDRIVVDMAMAKSIFAERLITAKAQAVAALLKKAEVSAVLGLESQYEDLAKLDLRKLGCQVMKATSPEQLLSLWPGDLSWDIRGG